MACFDELLKSSVRKEQIPHFLSLIRQELKYLFRSSVFFCLTFPTGNELTIPFVQVLFLLKIFPEVTGSTLFIISMVLFILHVPKIEMLCSNPLQNKPALNTSFAVSSQAVLVQSWQYSVLYLLYNTRGFLPWAAGGPLKHSPCLSISINTNIQLWSRPAKAKYDSIDVKWSVLSQSP